MTVSMVLSSDLPRTLSLDYLRCDVANGTWEPYVQRDEATGVERECKEEAENHLSCKVPNIHDFIRDVEGLEFAVSLSQAGFPDFPKFIPLIEKRFLGSDPQIFPCDFVAVPLRETLASCFKTVAGRWRSPSLTLSSTLRTSPLFSRKRVILCMSGQDVLIEKLWEKYDGSYLSALREIGFEFATSPNFSVFAGDCPLGHHINQKKSLVFAGKLQEAGIKAIPHIYPITRTHLSKYIVFFRTHPTVRLAIINCTLQRKAAEEVLNIHNRVSALLEAIPDLHLILQGLNFRDRASFGKFDSRLHYTSTSPVQSAIHKARAMYDAKQGKIVRVGGSAFAKEDLVRQNVQAYLDFYQHALAA